MNFLVLVLVEILLLMFLLVLQEVLAMKFNVLVTTYEFVMFDRSKLSRIDWKYIIIDEAQRMKDRDSVLARDLDRYRCQRRLLLTGTPLQVNQINVYCYCCLHSFTKKEEVPFTTSSNDHRSLFLFCLYSYFIMLLMHPFLYIVSCCLLPLVNDCRMISRSFGPS